MSYTNITLEELTTKDGHADESYFLVERVEHIEFIEPSFLKLLRQCGAFEYKHGDEITHPDLLAVMCGVITIDIGFYKHTQAILEGKKEVSEPFVSNDPYDPAFASISWNKELSIEDIKNFIQYTELVEKTLSGTKYLKIKAAYNHSDVYFEEAGLPHTHAIEIRCVTPMVELTYDIVEAVIRKKFVNKLSEELEVKATTSKGRGKI
ncbi:hypothetical protein JAO10_09155 [Burkholderia contaminans]|uniref:hypothetical protein n=1 Tax=Burkholderia cepacia complex TaxID=87882 RepID=UPI0018DD59D8|nr:MULTISPECIES: hypothetical protein [Burkholderia cepacia complex]MBH9720499.1 hypothetical protein [Burkholderia contaminans]MCO8552943.1 hypothetical protein [Burkholderia multivorans]